MSLIFPADFLKWCSVFGVPVGGSAPGGNNTFRSFVSAPISVGATGPQDLFTIAMPDFNFFLPDKLSIVVATLDTVTQSPTLSVGTNLAAYDDLLGQTPLTMLTDPTSIFQLPFNTGDTIGAGTLIRTQVSVVGLATALSLIFILTGNGINVPEGL